MPEIDRILEAEQIIGTVSQELKAMANAAELLKTASSNTGSVIESSQKIVLEVDAFVKASRSIIERLEAADIAGRLQAIDTGMQAIKAAVAEGTSRLDATQKEGFGETATSIGGMRALLESLIQEETTRFADLTDHLRGVKQEVAARAEAHRVQQATLQRIIIAFGSFLSAGMIVVLVKLLLG